MDSGTTPTNIPIDFIIYIHHTYIYRHQRPIECTSSKSLAQLQFSCINIILPPYCVRQHSYCVRIFNIIHNTRTYFTCLFISIWSTIFSARTSLSKMIRCRHVKLETAIGIQVHINHFSVREKNPSADAHTSDANYNNTKIYLFHLIHFIDAIHHRILVAIRNIHRRRALDCQRVSRIDDESVITSPLQWRDINECNRFACASGGKFDAFPTPLFFIFTAHARNEEHDRSRIAPCIFIGFAF